MVKKEEKASRKKKDAAPALVTQGGGKGGKWKKWPKGGKKGQGKGVQKFIKKEGKGAQGGKGGKVQIPCKFFELGKCERGASCKFLHETKEQATLVGGQGNWLAGDWECGACKAHNFAKNETCFKSGCGGKRVVKQEAKGKGKGGGKGPSSSRV